MAGTWITNDLDFILSRYSKIVFNNMTLCGFHRDRRTARNPQYVEAMCAFNRPCSFNGCAIAHVVRMSFSPAVRELFNRWKHSELLDELEASHQKLLDRRQEAVAVADQREPRKHTGSNCLVLQ